MVRHFGMFEFKAGTTSTIKWIAKTEVVSIDWA